MNPSSQEVRISNSQIKLSRLGADSSVPSHRSMIRSQQSISGSKQFRCDYTKCRVKGSDLPRYSCRVTDCSKLIHVGCFLLLLCERTITSEETIELNGHVCSKYCLRKIRKEISNVKQPRTQKISGYYGKMIGAFKFRWNG